MRLYALSLTCLLGLSTMGEATASTITAPLEARLATGGTHYVLVQLKPGLAGQLSGQKAPWLSPQGKAAIFKTQRTVESHLASSAWKTAYRFKAVPMLTGWGTKAAIEKLSKHPLVRAIGLDERIRANAAEALPFMGLDQAKSDFGLTGKGIVAVIFDTGIDVNNADFAGRIIIGGEFLVAGSAQPTSDDVTDVNGHGTNVAGILGSAGVNSPPGVAPEVDLLVYKVLNDDGDGLSSDWAYAMDHAVAMGLDELRVANLSLGTDAKFLACPCGDAQVPWQNMLLTSVGNLQAAGTLVFAATGNDAERGPLPMPACLDQVLGVGAVYDDVPYQTPIQYDNCTENAVQADKATCFTNMGACLDILSVGSEVISSAPLALQGLAYFGTSQAAPAAAGTAALVFEQLPSRTTEQVASLLLSTGNSISLLPDWNKTVPRLDIPGALAFETCGDGTVDLGEVCDDGPLNGSGCCTALCQQAQNGSLCDDGDVCTSSDTCAGGVCGGVDKDCSAADSNCSVGTCFDVDGSANCLAVAQDEGQPCDDGSVCTLETTCQNGVCSAAQDLDCSGFDGPCTIGVCDPALGCQAAFTPDGAPCEDGQYCTEADTCLAGACDPGAPRDCSAQSDLCQPGVCDEVADTCKLDNQAAPKVCDDANLCTQDTCDPNLGCANAPLSGPACDDGTVCTSDDSCVFGVCAGQPLSCSDGNPCTNDSCNPVAGCLNEPNALLCSDDDACTSGDYCLNSSCIPGNLVNCDDGNPCTDDVCLKAAGCTHVPNAISCDDGEDCTYGDECLAGNCSPGQLLVCEDGNSCTVDSCHPLFGCVFANDNNKICNDGTACTIGDYCKDGTCETSFVLDCDDGSTCTDDSCDPLIGCVNKNNVLPCNDADFCTIGDACAAGDCQPGGVPMNCNDGNQCTLDICIPNKGCVNSPGAGACVDGSACTKDDICAGGFCIPGLYISCDDANPCTADSCNAETGCQHAYVQEACTDGNICTVGDNCQSGTCVGKSIFECGDDNVCTDDTCQPGTGCIHVPNAVPCSDGNTCTLQDTCSQGICKSAEQMVCDDGNACTNDTCNAEVGCVYQPQGGFCDDLNSCTTEDQCVGGVCIGMGDMKCDDSNPCTLDICEPNGGCSHLAVDEPCNDNDACSLNDVCFAGLCQSGTPMNCNDGNPCTDDSCGVDGSCNHIGNLEPCTDGNACTEGDHCEAGTCAPLAIIDCDDGNQCSSDWCDIQNGCVHNPYEGACNDGNVCTIGDSCSGLTCLGGGTAFNCDDSNSCTIDYCDAATGCTFTPKINECDDGNQCTASDTCSQGQCIGIPISCDDKNTCTDDSCDPAVGCAHTINQIPCNDADACSKWDLCSNGSCLGTLVDCSDDNWCTDDECNILIGCTHKPNLKNCSDDDVCTVNDHCAAGNCIGDTIPCDDNNGCTTEICDPVEGCVSSPNNLVCNDGDQCTMEDGCSLGACKGVQVSCYDGNPCTDDSCSSETGCKNVANFDICDDTNECTSSDHCVEGVCVGELVECDDSNPCTDDSCLTGSGCSYVFNTEGCDDGLFCTVDENCWQGECGDGMLRDCSNFDKMCEASVCSEADDSCVLVNRLDGEPCDDGLFCSVEDQCIDASCVAGAPRDCSAWNGEETVGMCKESESRCAAVPVGDPPPSDDPPILQDPPSKEEDGDDSPIVLIGKVSPGGAGVSSSGCSQTGDGPGLWWMLLLALWAVWRRKVHLS